MKIPKLSVSRIESVTIPQEKCKVSPSRAAYLSDGCPGCETLRLKMQGAYADCTERHLTIASNPFSPLDGNVLHELAKSYWGKSGINRTEFLDKAEELYEVELKKLKSGWKMLGKPQKQLDYNKVAILYQILQSKNSRKVSSVSNGNIKTEYDLDSSLGLKGKLDYLWVDGSEAVIKDYKSGAIHDDEGKIKENYSIQLNLYRLMVCERYPEVKNVRMYLDDFAGHMEEVGRIDDQILKDKIDRLLKSIRSGEYMPGEDNCRYCMCGHICPNKIWQNPSGQNYFDMKGEIRKDGKSISIVDSVRNISVILAPTQSSRDLYDALEALTGHTVYLTNLRKVKDEPLVCRLTENSVACEIEA